LLGIASCISLMRLWNTVKLTITDLSPPYVYVTAHMYPSTVTTTLLDPPLCPKRRSTPGRRPSRKLSLLSFRMLFDSLLPKMTSRIRVSEVAILATLAASNKSLADHAGPECEACICVACVDEEDDNLIVRRRYIGIDRSLNRFVVEDVGRRCLPSGLCWSVFAVCLFRTVGDLIWCVVVV